MFSNGNKITTGKRHYRYDNDVIKTIRKWRIKASLLYCSCVCVKFFPSYQFIRANRVKLFTLQNFDQFRLVRFSAFSGTRTHMNNIYTRLNVNSVLGFISFHLVVRLWHSPPRQSHARGRIQQNTICSLLFFCSHDSRKCHFPFDLFLFLSLSPAPIPTIVCFTY